VAVNTEVLYWKTKSRMIFEEALIIFGTEKLIFGNERHIMARDALRIMKTNHNYWKLEKLYKELLGK